MVRITLEHGNPRPERMIEAIHDLNTRRVIHNNRVKLAFLAPTQGIDTAERVAGVAVVEHDGKNTGASGEKHSMSIENGLSLSTTATVVAIVGVVCKGERVLT